MDRLRVLENSGLRRIFGTEKEEVAGDWRRLHNEELHNSYASPNVVRMVKSRRMRWARHAVCVREMRNIYSFMLCKLEGKRPLGRPNLYGRLMLEWILMEIRMGRCGLDASGSGQ